MATLSATGLKKSFHSRLIVKDISLSIQTGEIVGLLGPNGAGKTTCFHMIIGLVYPDAGDIHIDDLQISHLSTDQRSQMGLGYLPQETSIFRKLTVQENIMAILQTRPNMTQQKMQQRLDYLMQEFHIEHLHNNLGMTLSGGECRRVEIARALATDPLFLLLDEPFAGIDPLSIGEIQNLIQYLRQQGIGILITDHNVRETLSSCDRSYIVHEGQIIAAGSDRQILDNEQVRKTYLGNTFNL
jgi:lipopolysaccharide export system ATP-binding protein